MKSKKMTKAETKEAEARFKMVRGIQSFESVCNEVLAERKAKK